MSEQDEARAVLADPMERIIAAALDAASISYVTDKGGGNPSALDFRLIDSGVEIEVKRMHSPRIAEQMARAEDVIAIQGEGAVRWFAAMLTFAARARAEGVSEGREEAARVAEKKFTRQYGHVSWSAGKDIAAAIRALGLAPRDGWKLVPIEPTETMVNAAVVPLNRTGSVRAVWTAMLAAAPAQRLGQDRAEGSAQV